MSPGDSGIAPEADGGTPPDGSPPGEDGGSTSPDASTMPTSPLVDPQCTDGMYSEPLPSSSADISDLVASYSPSRLDEFVLAVLERRYGTGHHLVQGALASGASIATFVNDTSSAQGVLRSLSTVVHECGHTYDHVQSTFGDDAYVITPALTFSCAQGDATNRGGRTFARSLIRDDEYQALRPPCGGGGGWGCDVYADLYLEGDPNNATFEQGDQGFNVLFEEVVQYVNSLATALAFTNELAGRVSVSERDGILTFLWYLLRYLRLARLEHPSAYEHLVSGDGGCWREAILTVWGRAWLYLDATAGMSHLGIDDGALLSLVMDRDLLSEIQRLREAEGCPAP